jgi:hypothetical protein
MLSHFLSPMLYSLVNARSRLSLTVMLPRIQVFWGVTLCHWACAS